MESKLKNKKENLTMSNFHIGSIIGGVTGLLTIIGTVIHKVRILWEELQTLKTDIAKLRNDIATMHETLKEKNPPASP